jgi:1,4-alpha-glucan branching enzyme
MNNVTQTFALPEVNGTFNNWCGGCAPMADGDGDGIWELVIPLNAGTYEYKFAADAWTIQETLLQGAPCTVNAAPFVNRSLNVTQDVVLDAVCWGACVGCNVVVPNYDVTFRVDMNNVTESFTLPNLNGSFNGWCGGCAPMSDIDGDGIWELVVSLPAGSYEYKFSADAWTIQENLTPGSPCTITVGPFTNRTLNVTGDVVLDTVCWGSCVSCATVVPQHDVTFRVDMNNVTQSFTLPEVNGTFNNWCGGCAPMTDADGDGIWELTVTLDEGSYEYKFAADGWGIQESLTQGDPCTVTNDGFTNRSLNLTGDVVLNAVCWGSCAACPAETFDVTFRVDMNNVTVPFTTPEVNGSFNNWCGACAPMSDVDGDGIWELVIALPAGAYEYKFTADGFSIQENLNPSLPCTVTNFGFTNRSLNVTTDVVLDAVCYGACVGCNAVIPDYNITFRVNMNNVTAPYTTPEVNGTFNNWCGGCAPMSDANGDGIWELVVTLPAGNYEYKFAADGWAIQETLTQGDPCTINGAPFVNRSLSVTGNTVLDAVCWGSCNVGSLTLYADNDGDGFGAGAGTLFCTNPGAGYAALNTDCNDANAAIYPGATEVCTNSIDDDCDGLVNEACPPTPLNNSRAAAALNAGSSFPVCGSNNGTLAGATASSECVTVAPSGAGQDVWYRFVAASNGVRIHVSSSVNDIVLELHNEAGDTVIGTENETGIGGSETLVAGTLVIGEAYYLAVRNFNPSNVGAFTYCIQHLATSAPNNGTTFSSLCGFIKARWTGAQLYSVTLNDGVNAPISASSTSTQLLFSQMPAIRYNTTYSAVFTCTYIQNDGAGNTSTVVVSSAPFSITTLDHPLTDLRNIDRCPSTKAMNSFVSTSSLVCRATSWSWEFEEVDESNNPVGLEGPQIVQTSAVSRYFRVSQIPGAAPGKRFRVRIRPTFSYGQGTFGPEQYLCIAGSASFADGVENVASFERSSFESNSTAVVYPNPSNGEFINVRFNNLQNAQTTMRILDNIGRVVYQNTFSTEGSLNTSVVFDRKLSSGVYSMEIINGTERRVEKMIVE